MTIRIEGDPYPTDPDYLVNGARTYANVFRAGDVAYLTDGAHIAAYDDDGTVFEARRYADDSDLGLGELITYHVHDNADGTINVYYQVRDADPLPAVLSSWVVTLDATTGVERGPATQITSGIFARPEQGMLQRAFDLPDGNIAVIQALDTYASAELVIATPDGDRVGGSGQVLFASAFGLRQQYDLTTTEDGRIALVWTSNAAGAARETFLRFFSMEGAPQGEPITVSQAVSDEFGVRGAAQIERLENGTLAVVWTEAIDNTLDADGGSVWFAIYSADGTVINSPTLVNDETSGHQFFPKLIATETGFIVLYSDFDIGRANYEQVLREYDMSGALLDTHRGDGGDLLIRVDNNTALAFNYQVTELVLPGAEGSLDPERPEPNRTETGTEGDDHIITGNGNDRIDGRGGHDTLEARDGTDTLIGGDGDDFLFGGATEADLRDIVYGGEGNDHIDGGYGNDELRGDAGHDTILGGFGADTVIGGDGDDTLTAQAYGDEISGGAGRDFINGGFGHDRVNGGAGADRFFHLGVADHGSDWIQDYNAADGDVLQFGAAATIDQFQVNFTETPNAGETGIEEAFVIYRPTGQILWALVDGAAQSEITLLISGTEYDLLA